MKSSILIPYYNSGSFLKATLSSIAKQTRLPDELIIVNDGSTQRSSVDLLEGLRDQYPFVTRVFHISNAGISGALTYGARRAQYDIIICVDADDVLDPQYVEKYMQRFNDPHVDAVTSGYKKFYSHRGYAGTEYFYKFYLPSGLVLPDLYYYNCGSGSNIAVRKKTLEEIDFWDVNVRHYQDWGMCLNLLVAKKNLQVIDEYLYYYRTHPASDSAQKDVRSVRDTLIFNILQARVEEFSHIDFETYKKQQEVFMKRNKLTTGKRASFSFHFEYFYQLYYMTVQYFKNRT